MNVNVRTQGNLPKKLAKAGLHDAVCYAITDLGTQSVSYQGLSKQVRKLKLTFELVDQLEVFREGEAAMPLVISKEYNLSIDQNGQTTIYEKSKLYGDLVSWLGSSKDIKNMLSIKNYLGKPAEIYITHGTSKIGNPYHEIKIISPNNKDIKGINTTKYFSFDEFTKESFDKLSKYEKETAMASVEYEALRIRGEV